MRKRAVNKREARINAFYKFLIDNDAFFEYRENVKRNRWETLRTVFNKSVTSWISSAFYWSHSPERSGYWCDLAIKWDEYAKKEISDDEK